MAGGGARHRLPARHAGTYLAGAFEPAATYAHRAGAAVNPAGINLHSTGRSLDGSALLDIRLDVGMIYKLVLKSTAGAIMRTLDSVPDGLPPAASRGKQIADGAVGSSKICDDEQEQGAILLKLDPRSTSLDRLCPRLPSLNEPYQCSAGSRAVRSMLIRSPVLRLGHSTWVLRWP